MERTWLITGCSSGLGKGIAKAVLARGDRAALTARDPAALAAFTAAYPGRPLALPLDLSHADSIPGWWRRPSSLRRHRRAGEQRRPRLSGRHRREPAPSGGRALCGQLLRAHGPHRAALPGMRRGAGDGSATSPPSAGCGAPWATGITRRQSRPGAGLRGPGPGGGRLRHPGDAGRAGGLPHGVLWPPPGGASTHLAAYDPIGDRYRKGPGPLPANQPGDPDRGGQRIVETPAAGGRPFRLFFLGSDAVEAARAAWEGRLREPRPWQGVSRQSDGGKGERP